MFNNDKEQLFYDALCEIAEHAGDSFENPLSVSLLCLTLGITNDEKSSIFISWNKILHENDYENLTVDLFKNSLNKIVPNSIDYEQKVVNTLIKAFSKNLIVELYPFSKTID